MPHVVDADVDDDEGRLLGQDVALEALLEVGDLVAADAGVEDLDAQVLAVLRQRVLDEGDVALRPPPPWVMESPRNTMRSPFARAGGLPGPAAPPSAARTLIGRARTAARRHERPTIPELLYPRFSS
jgi:hypothetical protein